MNNKTTIAIALMAGLLGGQLARFLTPATAFAQNPTPVVNNLRAQSFTLVDASGFTVGTFTAEPISGPARPIPPKPGLPVYRPMRIVLRDVNGQEIWTAGGSKVVPQGAQIILTK